ncbi:hypothetical protein E4U39_002585 [Claviceps sp. Clav50 group G5]|nr:hypothetical protein E4U39_002585 [Claviceps sp. Clav50 group G5]
MCYWLCTYSESQDHAAVLDHISGEASSRRTLDSKVLRGLSVQLHDMEGAEKRAEQIAAMPAVKQMWPNPLGFTGAATGVTLGAYRVFGCEGGGANDVMMAAFNKAFEDGANTYGLYPVGTGLG